MIELPFVLTMFMQGVYVAALPEEGVGCISSQNNPTDSSAADNA